MNAREPSPLQFSSMPGRERHHCKQWIEDGEEHDCWTLTQFSLPESALASATGNIAA